jgi:hypothetical protein
MRESLEPTALGTRQPGALRRWHVAQAMLCLVAGALLAPHLGRLADYAWWAIKCPYEIDYGEGVLLQYALNIARGGEVYNDFHHYPFVVATYPPVYPLLCAVGVKLSGVNFAFGRSLSILATLGVAALIWVMLRRARASRIAAGLGAVLFLGAPIVYWWGPLLRSCMAAVALGLAGLYCVMRGGRWLYPAVALMALALYTRQSEVAPLAASVAYLWWIKERRNAALVAAGWTALVAGAFAVLQAVSHGWFYQHVVVANRNLWEISRLYTLWWTTVRDWPAPFVMGVIGAGFALAGVRSGGTVPSSSAASRPERLFGLYFIFSVVVSMTAGKIGANVNYLLAPLAAACLLTGITYNRLATHIDRRAGKVLWIAAWMLVVLGPTRLLIDPGAAHKVYQFSRDDVMRGGGAAVAMIRSTSGDVLCEDTGLLPISGKPILLDPHKMTSMFHDGHWDQRQLVRDIAARKFALIITRWDPEGGATDQWGACGYYRWSIGMGRAIMRNYYLVKHVGFLYITAPADGKHPSCLAIYLRRKAESESKG